MTLLPLTRLKFKYWFYTWRIQRSRNRQYKINHQQYFEVCRRIQCFKEALPNEQALKVLSQHRLGRFIYDRIFGSCYFSDFIKKENGYFYFNVMGDDYSAFIEVFSRIEREAFGKDYSH